MYRKQLKEASQQEIFQAVSYVVKDVVIDDWLATQQAFDDQDPKIVYYMSMEFLMGRALGNNLINLKAYKEVKEALEEIGLNLDVIEDQEPDPALGNLSLIHIYVYIQTHNFPDPDAIASAFGLQELLKLRGIHATICYKGKIDRYSTDKLREILDIRLVNKMCIRDSIIGEEVPFLDLEVKQGVFGKLMDLFKKN